MDELTLEEILRQLEEQNKLELPPNITDTVMGKANALPQSRMGLPPLPGLDIGPDLAIGEGYKGSPVVQLPEPEPEPVVKLTTEQMEEYPWEHGVLLPLKSRGPDWQNRETELAAPQLLLDIIEAPGQIKMGMDEILSDPRIPSESETFDSGARNIIEGVVDLAIPVGGPLIVATRKGLNPGSIRAMKTQPLSFYPKKLKDIDPSGPGGIYTIETAPDLMKAYTADTGQVLADLYARAGAPNYDDVARRIKGDTGISASMRVNELMSSGKLFHTYGKIDLKITPDALLQEIRRMKPEKQKALDEYVKLRDFADDMRIRVAKRQRANEAGPLLRGALYHMRNIETVYPDAPNVAQVYRDITGSVRQFLSEGPYGLFDSEQLQWLSTNRANYVPIDISPVDPTKGLGTRMGQAMQTPSIQTMEDWFLQKRNTAQVKSIERRANAFELLADYTRQSVRFKLENDVRGDYIAGMKQSKVKTLRESTQTDKTQHTDHVIDVYEGGKKKSYTTTRLQRTLLKFDPYIVGHGEMLLYGPKRLAEQFMTGPASITFAPITMLRDSVSGFINTGAVDPLSTALVMPEMLKAQAFKAASGIFHNHLKGMPLIDTQQLADMAGNAYVKTLYHLSNLQGGTEASLMRSNVQVAKGAFAELFKAGKIPNSASKVVTEPVRGLWKTFSALYNIPQEAPRYAAFKKYIAEGYKPEDAAQLAKQITGDTTVSGMFRDPQGNIIDADLINPAARMLTRPAGHAVDFLRKSVPYVNPAIQGMRATMNAYIRDPAGTTSRAWLAVGLPAIMLYAWNEAGGPEYNEFAVNNRSSRDIVMNLYARAPGRPPNEGVEIPLAHETIMWASPFISMLYAATRGKEGEELKTALRHVGKSMMDNTLGLSIPKSIELMMTSVGQAPPDSLFDIPNSLIGGDPGTYIYKEDNVGMLPENAERLVRSLFGATGAGVMQASSAFHEGGPEAFASEFMHSITKRAPVVKNLAGTKTAVTSFTPTATEYYAELDNLREMMKVWEQHFGDNRTRSRDFSSDKGLMEGRDDPPIKELGPAPTLRPNNPIFEQYGGLVKSKLLNNEIGMKGLMDRYGTLTSQLRLLKGYTAGSAKRFREYQKEFLDPDKDSGVAQELQQKLTDAEQQLAPLKGKRLIGRERNQRTAITDTVKELKKELANAEANIAENERIRKLITDNKLDLGKRRDVNKLINQLEIDRKWILDKQLATMREVENEVTKDLTLRGLIPPGARFTIRRDFVPFIPQLDGSTPNQ